MTARRSSERRLHDLIDPHPRRSRLPEIILGGQDGLVNVLGVILGVASATREVRAVLAAGLAAAFSESVAMAAVAYTSKRAEGDRYRGEEARERRHIRAAPSIERDEVRDIFRQKGFEGEALERVVEVITANEDVWVGIMMSDEHALAPVAAGEPARAAWIVGVAAVVGSVLPLLPFAVLPFGPAIVGAIAVSTAALFLTGAAKGRLTGDSPARRGVEMTAIGLASAAVGYLAGALVGALVLRR